SCTQTAEVCLWLYPPVVGFIARALTALPIDLAYGVMRLGTVSATFAGLIAATRIWATDAPRSEPLIVGTIALSAPFVSTISLTHLDGLLLFAVALLAVALERNSGGGIGLAGVVLSLKPHLFVGLGLAVAAALASARRWRTLLWAVGVSGAYVATSLLLAPEFAGQLIEAS